MPRDMVLVTLRAMALGGMRDHIGGGFHRYSVDADWRVPHFEKMLYDQAQLVLAYVEAAQVDRRSLLRRRRAGHARLRPARPDRRRRRLLFGRRCRQRAARSTRHEPQPHKMEGAFYIWRDDEIRRRARATMPTSSALRFGVLPDGNAPFDPQNEFTDKNLLYTARSLDDDRRR